MLGGLLLLVAISGGLFLRDATAVRAALVAAERELREVQAALADADADRAAAQLRAADAELAVARSRSRGPLWELAAVLPVARQPVAVVRGVVDVASAATAVADVAVREGELLLSEGLEIRVDAGVVDLEPIRSAGALIDELPLAALRESTARLAATDPGWSPSEILVARDRVLRLADDALELVDRGEALLGALPGFLGADGPRRYFLGVQTSGELRATGGLIGFYAVLGVDDGAFTLGEVDVYEGLDDAVADGDADRVLTGPIGQLSGPRTEEADAPAWFTVRYAHTEATSRFSNINVHPDLPVTAAVALDLYARRTGDELDGMILVDPVGLQAVLEATDAALPLPAELIADTDLPALLPPAEFARFVTVDIYDTFGSGRGSERKQLLGELGAAAFRSVFATNWDGVAVGRAVVAAAAGRHLQIYSTSADEQASFSAVGVTGDFATPIPGDRLAVIANNAVGGKQDVHLGHRLDVEITLGTIRRDDEGWVTRRGLTVRPTVVNPLTPTAFDEYIVGNCLVDEARNQCFEGPPGWNRTWVSVWTPGDDRLQAAYDDDGSIGVVAGAVHDQRVFDRYLEVPPTGERSFALELAGPIRLEDLQGAGRSGTGGLPGGDPTVSDAEVAYTWSFWRQAKAIPDVLEVTVRPPAGWRIVDATLTGGGDTGRLFGLDAEVAPAQLDIAEDRVRLSGAVARDTSLTVALARAR